jgi:uncharacterized membrane protein
MFKRHRGLEWFSALVLLCHVGMVVVHYGHLPERVPSHFGITGIATAWSGKEWVWLLPSVATLVYGALSFAQRRPETMNMPFAGDKNDPRTRRILEESAVSLKGALMVMMAVLTWEIMKAAVMRAPGISAYFAPFALGCVIVPVAAAMMKLRKA